MAFKQTNSSQRRQNWAGIRSCANIGKKRKRVLVLEIDEVDDEFSVKTKVAKLNPSRVGSKSVIKPLEFSGSPKTPLSADGDFDFRLESLPMDILVNILCYLHHDQLKAAILVSKRISDAVLAAKEWHFNYTTPCRDRQEMPGSEVPLATKNGPLVSKREAIRARALVPRTPKAPFKLLAAPRVLVYEDELCYAVAENKL